MRHGLKKTIRDTKILIPGCWLEGCVYLRVSPLCCASSSYLEERDRERERMLCHENRSVVSWRREEREDSSRVVTRIEVEEA